MTGEMVKPENAERGARYWKGKGAIGDESICIRPNYPDYFELADKIRELGVRAEVMAFDVYQGPYISIEGGAEVWGIWDEVTGRDWFIRHPVLENEGTTVKTDREVLDFLKTGETGMPIRKVKKRGKMGYVQSNVKSGGRQEFFTAVRVHRQDVEQALLNLGKSKRKAKNIASSLDDMTMKRIAEKVEDAYVGQGYWTDLEIVVESVLEYQGIQSNRRSAGRQEFFTAVRVHRDDVEEALLNLGNGEQKARVIASSLDDMTMKRIAEKVGDAYLNAGYWTDLEIVVASILDL